MATKKSSPIIEFLMVIVERGKIEKAITILQNMRVDAQVVSFGKGTTDSSIAEYFGTDGKEKEVLFAIIKLRDEETILTTLSEKLKFEEKKHRSCTNPPNKECNILHSRGVRFCVVR